MPFELCSHFLGSLPCIHTGTTYLPQLLSGHTKSVITKPQNVFVMRDIMCSGYVAGGNCHFFGSNKRKPASAMKPGDVKTALTARLAMNDDHGGDYESMLAFACPLDETEYGSRDQVISISQRLLPWEVRTDTTNAKKGFPGGTAGFDAYSAQFGLDTIHYGEDIRASENAEFLSNGSLNNATCILGPHRKYNPFSQNYYELVPGQGHFGPDAIPGVRCRAYPQPRCLAHTKMRTARPCMALTVDFPLCHFRVAGRALAPWRGGQPQVGTRLDDLARGGGAFAAHHAPSQRRVSWHAQKTGRPNDHTHIKTRQTNYS